MFATAASKRIGFLLPIHTEIQMKKTGARPNEGSSKYLPRMVAPDLLGSVHYNPLV